VNDNEHLEAASIALLDLCGDVESLRVLDLACGDGRIARELARRGAIVSHLGLCEVDRLDDALGTVAPAVLRSALRAHDPRRLHQGVGDGRSAGRRAVALSSAAAAGTFVIGGDLPVNRLGFGAMRLCGPGIWGSPEDPTGARAVLRRAVDLGVNLIDTADVYGPGVNETQIAEALHPYPRGLVIATKGAGTRESIDDWGLDGRPERFARRARPVCVAFGWSESTSTSCTASTSSSRSRSRSVRWAS
jgi:SAM-dependent methyltransferase